MSFTLVMAVLGMLATSPSPQMKEPDRQVPFADQYVLNQDVIDTKNCSNLCGVDGLQYKIIIDLDDSRLPSGPHRNPNPIYGFGRNAI